MIEMFDTLVRRIGTLALEQPDHLAVAFKKETLTYKELNVRIRQIALRLAQLGVKKGDKVPLTATSKPEMAAAYLGIQYLGAAAVLVDKNAAPKNAYFIYDDVSAGLFLTDRPMKEYADQCHVYSLRALYQEAAALEIPDGTPDYVMPDPEDLAEMIYTSGTTGLPKGVMLTYKAVYHIWTNTVEGIGMLPTDRILLPLPLNHSFALRVLRAGLSIGAAVILQNGFTFAKEIENNQAMYDCTAIAIVPASVETITKQMQDKFAQVMGKFRYIEVSAGSLSVEQRKRLTRLLPDTLIYNTWGSSESGGALFLNVTEAVKDEKKVAALGKPLPCLSVKTLDEQGKEFVSDREHPGRMALKGDMQMAGYWNRPEVTAQTLVDGWLLTGDMIYIDLDGYLFMLGRADDIINVGGEKVSPVEVENIAGEYESIAECACIGVEDPEKVLGYVPVLFLVTRGCSFAEEDLKRYLSSRMEKYKVPAAYVQMLSLPRNRMQKIDRKALKAVWDQGGRDHRLNKTIKDIFTRRSIRTFKDQEIPKSILETIVTAGYYAPSGHNLQTWQFTVVTNPQEIRRIKELGMIAAKENKVYFYGFDNPKALILVSNDERNPYSCQNASCAAQNIMLAAWSYGIGSVWLNPFMTLRKKDPVKEVFDSYGIPENHIIWSMIALGYPVAEGTLLKKKTDVVKWID